MDLLRNEVRDLYHQLRALRSTHAFKTFVQKTVSPYESEAGEAVQSLRRVYDALSDLFQKLLDAGQIAEARQVKLLMDQIAAATIAINRAVIDYLDNSGDIVAAKEQLAAAQADLEAEAERVKDDVTLLDNVAGALDVVTQLVNL